MIFANRTQAGLLLAERIKEYLQRHGVVDPAKIVVVGLPRGGVPVALEVGRKLRCPVDIIAAKKLPYPGQPEYAIGAVSSDGVVVLSPDIGRTAEWNNYVEEQRQLLLVRTKQVENEFYRLAGIIPTSFNDKTVILVDDGIATGMTALAAVETARRRGAKRVVLSAPVMSHDSYSELSKACDVITISIPREFQAVGLHYADFAQTTNEEVLNALMEASRFGTENQFAKHSQAN